MSSLSAKQYKYVLELMEDAILATDLVVFFENRAKLDDIIKNNKFSWSTPDHRYYCSVQLFLFFFFQSANKMSEVENQLNRLFFGEGCKCTVTS